MARRETTLTVQRTEKIAPDMVRVYLGDPGFDDFHPNEHTDSYVKLLFGDVKRTYTVRAVDVVAREIAIDFVVHGDEGIAGPWAATVQPGETISMMGPGGAYAPRSDADWHLLAGDESALPAISAAVAALPANATAKVFVEVYRDSNAGISFDTAADLDVRLIRRDGVGAESALVDAVKTAEWLPGQPHVFVHGEAEAVMHGIRPYIRRERGVAAEWASISGYWRRGRTEEGFRVWKSELAAAEAVS